MKENHFVVKVSNVTALVKMAHIVFETTQFEISSTVMI